MTYSNEPLPNSCVVCTNKFTLLPIEAMSARVCPFCGSVVWPATAAASEPLSAIGDFEVVRPVDWEAPAVVFEAIRKGERFLITLLDSEDLLYSSAKRYRDLGQDVPYGTIENLPHPNFLEYHPVQWVGDVAIAAIEYIDGKTLLDWVKEVGPINVSDAVSIVLACARFVLHVDGVVSACEIKQQTIHVTQHGEIKITAFGGALLIPFLLSQEQHLQRELRSHRVERSNQRGLGMGFYSAPETARNGHHSDHTDEERRLESVYCLGCLLFELITDRPTPRIAIGIESIRNFEWVPVHEIQPTAPTKLSTIINRMTAFDPSQRYQDFESLIDDLEALDIDSTRVSFVNRTGPPVDEQAIQAELARQWCTRTDEYDFRKIKWGMTQDEVREAEPMRPTLVMPIVMMFDAAYHDLALLLVYQFAEDEGHVVCIGVSLQQSRAIHEEYVRQKSANDDSEARKLGSHSTYEKFKELIVADYGEPELIDGPLNEDPEYLQALADQSDSENPEDVSDCKSTVWQTESTFITLSIGPGLLGGREISASFVSMKHGRFIPGHPDYKPT